MAVALSSDQQGILNQLGVTYDQFLFYQNGRIGGRCLTQSMAALLWYDFFLTLGEEVQYVWKTKPRISVAKILWFLNRYWPLASVCMRVWAMAYVQPTKLFTAWSGMFNIAVVDVLLMLRVWALYNGSRRVMWFLIGVLVIGLPAAIAIRKVPPLPSIPLITPAPQSLTICKRSPPSELFSLFTMALAIETVIFSMVIIKAWGKQFRSSTPVLTVLIRDGALYYAAITGVLAFMIAATMIPILYQPVADANLNIPLCSLACNRLVLSLRGAYFRASGQGQTTLASYDITNRPNFAVNPNSTFDTKNQSRDIQLDSIRVTSPQTSTPLKRGNLDEYDWVPASARSPISPDRASVENGSRATQRRPSLIRKGSASTGDDPLHRRPSAVRWGSSHVKVTQTHTVHDDDGVDLTYDIPSPEVDTAHKEGFERTHGLDWWDTREKGYEEDSGVHGGGYDARRGRRTDRIEEDIEPSFDGPYTSHSGRAV